MTALDPDYLNYLQFKRKEIHIKESIMSNAHLYENISSHSNFSLLEIPCIISTNFKYSAGLDVGSKFILKIEK
jgi:hypothetical protein